jgi:hypothetical protein
MLLFLLGYAFNITLEMLQMVNLLVFIDNAEKVYKTS